MNELLILSVFIGIGFFFGIIITHLYYSDKFIDSEFDKRYFQMQAIKQKCEKDNFKKRYYTLLEKQDGDEVQ